MKTATTLRVSRLVRFFAAEQVRQSWITALNNAGRHEEEAKAAEHQAHHFMYRENWDLADSFWKKAANLNLRAAAEHLSYGGENWARPFEDEAERCFRMIGQRPRVQERA